MESFLVEGGRRLSGHIRVDGAKNAALPILAACVLTEEAIVLLYDRPVMLLFSRDEETEQQLRTILDAYGKGDTIHRCRVKEKKKGR